MGWIEASSAIEVVPGYTRLPRGRLPVPVVRRRLDTNGRRVRVEVRAEGGPPTLVRPEIASPIVEKGSFALYMKGDKNELDVYIYYLV